MQALIKSVFPFLRLKNRLKLFMEGYGILEFEFEFVNCYYFNKLMITQ